MMFSKALHDVTSCPGVLAAAISDRDGIPVQTWGDDKRIEEVVAEFSTFLREVASASRELDLGEMDQVQVAGTQKVVMVTNITPEYFLVTLVARDGNPGRARFASRLAAFRLRQEFE